MDNILFFLTPKALCSHLMADDTLRQALVRMEAAKYQALPIRMELTGQQSDILSFMSAFENDEEGSYIIQAASMEMDFRQCVASVTMYLCTPQPQEQPQQ